MPAKEHRYYVYILTSHSGTLYTGITNNLAARTRQHKNKETLGFTSKYDVNRLVYYETYGDVRLAIRREKEIKGWTRKKKIALIESQNRRWEDLSEQWGQLLPQQQWQVRDPLENERRGDSSGKRGPQNDKGLSEKN
jgi:putative endonuclease